MIGELRAGRRLRARLERELERAGVLGARRHAERPERAGELVRLAARAVGELGVQGAGEQRGDRVLHDVHAPECALPSLLPQRRDGRVRALLPMLRQGA